MYTATFIITAEERTFENDSVVRWLIAFCGF